MEATGDEETPWAGVPDGQAKFRARIDPNGATMRVEGTRPTALHNNCSGKHAGMMLAALTRGEPTDGYLADDPNYRGLSVTAPFKGGAFARAAMHDDIAACFSLALLQARRKALEERKLELNSHILEAEAQPKPEEYRRPRTPRGSGSSMHCEYGDG